MHTRKKIHYIHFDSLDSTNTWTKRNAHTLDPNPITCITALEQTAGRGRFQRQWLSPKGQNLYATLYFSIPKQNSSYLHNLGQILSFSCTKILQSKGFHPQIKWPNDILLSQKKVAGILCEIVPFDEYFGVVLGIGINVNMSEELLARIDQPATSLAQLTGHPWKFEQILEPLIYQFLDDLFLLQTEGFKAFHQSFNELLAFKGEPISCYATSGQQEKKAHGICHSIDTDGRLNLQLPSGELLTLTSYDFKLH